MYQQQMNAIPMGNAGNGRGRQARVQGNNGMMQQQRPNAQYQASPAWMQQQAQPQQQSQQSWQGGQPQQPYYGYNQPQTPPPLQHNHAQGVNLPGMNPAAMMGMQMPSGMGGGIVPNADMMEVAVAAQSEVDELKARVERLEELTKDTPVILNAMSTYLMSICAKMYNHVDPTVDQTPELLKLQNIAAHLVTGEDSNAAATAKKAAAAAAPKSMGGAVSGFTFSPETYA